jgi:hypothetical protein
MHIFSNPHPYVYGDSHMRTAIPIRKILHMGIQVVIFHMEMVPICIWVITELSLYAYRDHGDPHINTTGIENSAILVCIWGSRSIPIYIRGLMNPRMHTRIVILTIPVCIWGFINPLMHLGIEVSAIPKCIRGLTDPHISSEGMAT